MPTNGYPVKCGPGPQLWYAFYPCYRTFAFRISQDYPPPPNSNPDARAKNYLDILRNYYSTKTTDLKTEHKS